MDETLSTDSADATASITSDSTSWLSDFGSSALQGLGFGSPQQAAQTLGSVLRPVVQPAATNIQAQAAAAASGSAPKPPGMNHTTELLLLAGVAIAAVLILR